MAGKITRMVTQDKDPNRVSVFIDGAFAFGVYQDLVLAFDLVVGRTLSDAEQERIQAEEKYLQAKALAVGFIAYRARTGHEVRSKLTRSGYEDEIVSRVHDRLLELGLINDEAYARSFVSARFQNKGYGPKRLRSELLRRGIAKAIVEGVLAEVLKPDETLNAARELAQRRWTRLSSESDPRKRRRKLSDFLVRRGYAYDTVRQVVDEVAKAP